MTSSPRPTPMAARDSRSASSPFATPMQCFTPRNSGELLLESFQFAAQQVPSTVKDPRDRLIDFFFELEVRSLKIEEWNRQSCPFTAWRNSG